MWKIQHNVLHHSFTNIDGLDEDIDTPGILRFSPDRPLKKVHKLQFIYAWFFYGVMTLFWMTAKDWMALARYRKKGLIKSSGSTVPQLVREMIVSKVLYFGYIIGLPLSSVACRLDDPGWMDGDACRNGLDLGLDFPACTCIGRFAVCPSEAGAKMEDDTFSHQLKSTANFGTGSRVFTWLCGGLNHQIEHHLFPNVCHIHFRALAPIVKKTAEEFGLHLPFLHHVRKCLGTARTHALAGDRKAGLNQRCIHWGARRALGKPLVFNTLIVTRLCQSKSSAMRYFAASSCLFAFFAPSKRSVRAQRILYTRT